MFRDAFFGGVSYHFPKFIMYHLYLCHVPSQFSTFENKSYPNSIHLKGSRNSNRNVEKYAEKLRKGIELLNYCKTKERCTEMGRISQISTSKEKNIHLSSQKYTFIVLFLYIYTGMKTHNYAHYMGVKRNMCIQ